MFDRTLNIIPYIVILFSELYGISYICPYLLPLHTVFPNHHTHQFPSCPSVSLYTIFLSFSFHHSTVLIYFLCLFLLKMSPIYLNLFFHILLSIGTIPILLLIYSFPTLSFLVIPLSRINTHPLFYWPT